MDIAQKRLAIARGYIQPTLSLSGSWGTGYSGAAEQVDPTKPVTLDTVPVGFFKKPDDTYQVVSRPEKNYQFRIKSFTDQLRDNSNQSVGFNLSIPIFNGWAGRTAISHQSRVGPVTGQI